MVGHGLCQFLVKIHIDGRDRRPNFVLFVACSAVIVSGGGVAGWCCRWVVVVLAWCRKFYLGPAEIMCMFDGPIETVECIWVNTWCMVDCVCS